MRVRFFGLLLVLGALPSLAAAQTTPEMVLNPWSKDHWGETTDKLLFQEQGHMQGNSGDKAQLFWWDSIGRFRLSTTDDHAPVIAYRYVTGATDSNSPLLPDHLDKVSMAGGVYLGKVADGEVSLVGGAGWSGNNPFADANGIFGIGHVLWNRRINDTDSLVLSVDYNGGGAFLADVPLPGFQWVHRDLKLSYGAGYPRSFVQWEIVDRLTLTANYLVPYTADAYLDYRLANHWSVFGNMANFFEAFQLDKQPDTVRLFWQMSRAEVGVRYQNDNIWKGLGLDLAVSVGYAFNQSFYQGWDVRDLNETAQVSDEPYIAVILRGVF